MTEQEMKQVEQDLLNNDSSHLWPVNGAFIVAEVAIQNARRWEENGGYFDDALSYQAWLKQECSRIENDETRRSWPTYEPETKINLHSGFYSVDAELLDGERADVEKAQEIAAGIATWLPHGSGIDGSWTIEQRPTGWAVRGSYHMMNENGHYVEWQDFSWWLEPDGSPRRAELNGGHSYQAKASMLLDYLSDLMHDMHSSGQENIPDAGTDLLISCGYRNRE